MSRQPSTAARIIEQHINVQADDHDTVHGRDDDHREHRAGRERGARLDADELLVVVSLERVSVLGGERDQRPRGDETDHRVLAVHDSGEREHDQDGEHREVRADREVATGDLLERDSPADHGRRGDPREIETEDQLAREVLLPLKRVHLAVVVGEQIDRQQHEPEHRDVERREVHEAIVEEQAPAGVRDAREREEHAEHVGLGRVVEERERRLEDVGAERHAREHVDEAPDRERVRRRRDERLVLELRAVALRKADPREHELQQEESGVDHRQVRLEHVRRRRRCGGGGPEDRHLVRQDGWLDKGSRWQWSSWRAAGGASW